MTGAEDNDDQEGIIPRVCRSLFRRAVEISSDGGVGSQRASLASIAHPGAPGSTFTASYVEIYCEKVKDLLISYPFQNRGGAVGSSAAASPRTPSAGGARSSGGAGRSPSTGNEPHQLKVREHPKLGPVSHGFNTHPSESTALPTDHRYRLAVRRRCNDQDGADVRESNTLPLSDISINRNPLLQHART